MKVKKDVGFTLLEVMLVIVILSILAAVAVPRLTASSETAREKADITTGKEVKSALDRYQIENGLYPRIGELQANNGTVTGQGFIPEYIKRLDSDVTQQTSAKKGFGIAEWVAGGSDSEPTNLIMLYLTEDGSAAEVLVYNRTLTEVLWSSI